jgi:hypothetical protein
MDTINMRKMRKEPVTHRHATRTHNTDRQRDRETERQRDRETEAGGGERDTKTQSAH